VRTLDVCQLPARLPRWPAQWDLGSQRSTG